MHQQTSTNSQHSPLISSDTHPLNPRGPIRITRGYMTSQTQFSIKLRDADYETSYTFLRDTMKKTFGRKVAFITGPKQASIVLHRSKYLQDLKIHESKVGRVWGQDEDRSNYKWKLAKPRSLGGLIIIDNALSLNSKIAFRLALACRSKASIILHNNDKLYHWMSRLRYLRTLVTCIDLQTIRDLITDHKKLTINKFKDLVYFKANIRPEAALRSIRPLFIADLLKITSLQVVSLYLLHTLQEETILLDILTFMEKNDQIRWYLRVYQRSLETLASKPHPVLEKIDCFAVQLNEQTYNRHPHQFDMDDLIWIKKKRKVLSLFTDDPDGQHIATILESCRSLDVVYIYADHRSANNKQEPEPQNPISPMGVDVVRHEMTPNWAATLKQAVVHSLVDDKDPILSNIILHSQNLQGLDLKHCKTRHGKPNYDSQWRPVTSLVGLESLSRLITLRVDVDVKVLTTLGETLVQLPCLKSLTVSIQTATEYACWDEKFPFGSLKDLNELVIHDHSPNNSKWGKDLLRNLHHLQHLAVLKIVNYGYLPGSMFFELTSNLARLISLKEFVFRSLIRGMYRDKGLRALVKEHIRSVRDSSKHITKVTIAEFIYDQ